jgi:hypothetical protein
MLDCDWCEKFFATSDLFNVEYKSGTANVLCENCVDESIELFNDDFKLAWR